MQKRIMHAFHSLNSIELKIRNKAVVLIVIWFCCGEKDGKDGLKKIIILLIESTARCCCTFDWVHFLWKQSFRAKSPDVEAAVEEEDIETAVGNFLMTMSKKRKQQQATTLSIKHFGKPNAVLKCHLPPANQNNNSSKFFR